MGGGPGAEPYVDLAGQHLDGLRDGRLADGNSRSDRATHRLNRVSFLVLGLAVADSRCVGRCGHPSRYDCDASRFAC